MNCKYFYLFLGNKKFKMTYRLIPSNGIGEIYLDLSNMQWCLYESPCYNIDKEIPFMKLLLDMASLRMRYYTQLNGNRLLLPQVVLNLAYTSSMLIKSFIKIKSLSEDFFCTGNIETLNYCMHVYNQYIKKEPLYYFISGHWEIDLVCQKMKCELDRFLDQLEKLFQTFLTVILKKSLLYKQDLIKQFIKFIFGDGKYFSESYAMIEELF